MHNDFLKETIIDRYDGHLAVLGIVCRCAGPGRRKRLRERTVIQFLRGHRRQTSTTRHEKWNDGARRNQSGQGHDQYYGHESESHFFVRRQPKRGQEALLR